MNDLKYFYLNNSDGLTLGVIGATSVLELIGKICLCFSEHMCIELESVQVRSCVHFDEFSEQDVYIKYEQDGEEGEDTLYLGLTALY